MIPTGVELINVVSARTEFDPDAYPVVIKVVGIIGRTKDGRTTLEPGEKVSFKLQNLRTPTTTVTSSSFKVYTKDGEDRIVNFVETDLDVTMLRGIAIDTMEITSSSQVVGNIAAHTFTFDTPIPLLPEN